MKIRGVASIAVVIAVALAVVSLIAALMAYSLSEREKEQRVKVEAALREKEERLLARQKEAAELANLSCGRSSVADARARIKESLDYYNDRLPAELRASHLAGVIEALLTTGSSFTAAMEKEQNLREEQAARYSERIAVRETEIRNTQDQLQSKLADLERRLQDAESANLDVQNSIKAIRASDEKSKAAAIEAATKSLNERHKIEADALKAEIDRLKRITAGQKVPVPAGSPGTGESRP